MNQAAYNNSFIGKNPHYKHAQHQLKPLSSTRQKSGFKGMQILDTKSGPRYIINITLNGQKKYLGSHKDKQKALKIIDDYGVKHDIARYKHLSGKHEDTLTQYSQIRLITIDGKTKTVLAWCEYYGIKYNTWRYRVGGEMNEIAALQKPLDQNPQRVEKAAAVRGGSLVCNAS